MVDAAAVMEDQVPDSYLEIKDPTYNPDGSICVYVKTTSSNGEFWPYTATPDAENDPTCRAIYQRAIAGEYGEIGPIPQERLDMKAACELEAIGRKRDMLVSEANDVCQPLAEEKDLGIITDDDLARYKRWALYRQALRKLDVTKEVEWPEKPE